MVYYFEFYLTDVYKRLALITAPTNAASILLFCFWTILNLKVLFDYTLTG